METDKHYVDIFQAAVNEIRTARASMACQVNVTAIGFYWNPGKLLSERKLEKGHGAGVVKRLSADLKSEFPDMGLSPRNLWDMKRFYETYHDATPKLRQAVAVLPWKHNLLILSKAKSHHKALFYTDKVIEYGWSNSTSLKMNPDTIIFHTFENPKRQSAHRKR